MNEFLNFNLSSDENICNDNDWQNAYSKNNGRYYESIVVPFLNYGIKEENINWINYFKDTEENAKAKIKNANIIFFTGGLPDKMMLRLKEFNLIDDIENFTGVIIGSSVGAMIQISEYHITQDEDYKIFTYNTGLNLIKDFDIKVHYEETEIQNKCINKVLEEKRKKVYAITNTGGIIIDNKKITLLGNIQTFSKQ
ncbi:Type 1 glutamine amidotransferase-like domain-containing protein [Clostridium beijerinckii]|uniref:Peptidase family S51 n=1 Tax=Clostridium beijerinckii TaxID=1520 RepID=A0A1S8S2D7_CLOBE|nr:Type 1 glutamine amidotransferase-like domain-containing protein [Clostridium beijerinckii]NRY58942.1 peptidase E [Clostridium beijerinckii]OOM59588.1 peptidase family S51 [Clostridium beijerinckii]